MLAQTAMSVVFVLAEKIRRGTDLIGNGGRNDYGFTMSEYSWKVPQWRYNKGNLIGGTR